MVYVNNGVFRPLLSCHIIIDVRILIKKTSFWVNDAVITFIRAVVINREDTNYTCIRKSIQARTLAQPYLYSIIK